MAQTDPISSTEKLLDLIRSKGQPEQDVAVTVSPGRRRFRFKSSFSRFVALKRTITIGASLGYNDLRLVKIGQTTEKKQELLSYSQVPYPRNLTRESPQFPQFLKRVLKDFCGDEKKVEIWSAISSAKVEMRYLRIPKVPRSQVANTVYWTFRKDVSFNEKEEMFDFELIGDVTEGGFRKTEVLSYTAPHQEISQLKTLFAKSGFPLSGITIVPFLLQNLLRVKWLNIEGKNVCSLYIGRDWSRIDIFSKGNLVLCRGIKAGMKSMIEAIRQKIDEPASPVPTEGMPDGDPEGASAGIAASPSVDRSRQIFASFLAGKPGIDGDPEHNDPEIFEMIKPAYERLIRQVERTLDHYALKFDSEGVGKIYISGPVNSQQRMVGYIGEQLGLPIDVFDPLGDGSPLAGDIVAPETLPEREAYLPAIGMALSNNTLTPNFIFTYKDKEKEVRNRRINRTLFISMALLLSVCIGIYGWQDRHLERKETAARLLQRELDAFAPRVDKNMILALFEKTARHQKVLKQLGQRYKAMAVLREVSALTPEHIRLLNLSANIGASGKGAPNKLTIVGVVLGDRDSFQSKLANYLISIEKSILFGSFKILNRSFMQVGGEEAMRFTAQIDLT